MICQESYSLADTSYIFNRYI